MQVVEIVFISIVGVAALAFTVYYIIRSIKSKDKCSHCAYSKTCDDIRNNKQKNCDKYVDTKK